MLNVSKGDLNVLISGEAEELRETEVEGPSGRLGSSLVPALAVGPLGVIAQALQAQAAVAVECSKPPSGAVRSA
jgi:hypothetical protein